MNEPELSSRYRLIRRLGAGHTGEVLLGEHLLIRRLEAIKILRLARVMSERDLSRFRREARALSRLDHPNIVAIYDCGRLDDGRCFLTMEYADGDVLHNLVHTRAPLPLNRQLDILAQIADAVDHAHSRGVIHRDLKPSNVVVTRSPGGGDLPKVLDFGFAKMTAAVESETGLTSMTDSGAMGTPYYMAPEMLTDRPWDHRVDIYSLGCTAFEVLAGVRPFEGPVVAAARAHVTEPVPRLSDRVSHVPRDICDIIYLCMAKDPQSRVPKASLVSDVIRRAAAARAPSGMASSPRQVFGVALPTLQPDVDLEARITQRFRAGTTIAAIDQDTQKITRPSHIDAAKILPRIAAALLDEGCDDIELVLAGCALAEQQTRFQRVTAELEAARHKRTAWVRIRREQEAALRLALADLQFALDRATAPGPRRAIENATALVSGHLIRSGGEWNTELAAEEAQEAKLVRAVEEASQNVLRKLDALEVVVSSLVPAYMQVPRVQTLWHSLQAAAEPDAVVQDTIDD